MGKDLFWPKALVRTTIPPVQRVRLSETRYFLDFGKAAFGTVKLDISDIQKRLDITVHLGEALSGPHSVDRRPPGSILYRKMVLSLEPGIRSYTLVIPPDERNTGPMAIPMPSEAGEVMPFRYCELENFPFDDFSLERIAIHYPFDDSASSFTSSDRTLNAVWDLCKYTIKATSFCGIYVDGDRERIPYEGDAYINQLCHYCVDAEYSMARATQEYLYEYPTWPTEWQFHMVFMAWADWMHTGDRSFLERNYTTLKLKTLVDLAREDGLVSTESCLKTREFEEKLNLYHEKYIYDHGLRDLVDWPPGSFNDSGQGERDNHEMRPCNTVINAFHYRTLILMSRIASALGRSGDARFFTDRAAIVKASFKRVFFDDSRKIYIDGEGSGHASLHSNMYALAFGLVDEERKGTVADFVKSRGMACSVYGAQYLLEALYSAGEEESALELMSATHDRSWWNMIACGSTMTLEAWDWKYKNNLDWNHAWGAAPANIIPRYLMGIRPLEPGYKKILIQPRPGNLDYAECLCPTINGAVKVSYKKTSAESGELALEIPEGTTARIDFPAAGAAGSVENLPSGEHHIVFP